MPIAISPDSPEDFNFIKSFELPPKCCICGTTENLTFGPDPLACEIYLDCTPVWQCEECREEGRQAI